MEFEILSIILIDHWITAWANTNTRRLVLSIVFESDGLGNGDRLG